MATAAITGTITPSASKADIVAGGKTIIATLTGDTFVPATAQIVFVGSQSGNFAGTTSDQTITMTSLTGGIASAPAAGDLVIVTFGVGGGAGGGSFNASLVIQNTSAVDYTLIGSELNVNDNNDANLRVAYRFMPSTPETQFVLVGGTTNTTAAGAWTVHVFRGVDPTTPMDVAAVTATGFNGRRPDPPSITPSTSGAWMFFAGSGAASATDTFTAGYLSAFGSATQSDSVCVITGAGYRAWTSGAYDGAAWGSGTTSTKDSWCAVVCALRPSTTTQFDAARQFIIDGLDSAQSEANGWDAVVKAGIATSAVVRTSSTVCTITLPAFASYNITANETITVTIPGYALASGVAIVATPTFDILNSTTHAAATTLSGAAAITPLGRLTFSGAAAISGTGAVAPVGSITLKGASTLPGAVTLSPVGVLVLPGTGAYGASAALAALATVANSTAFAAISGSLAVSAVPLLTLGGRSALSGALAVSPVPLLTLGGRSAMPAAATLAALQRLTIGGRSAISGSALLAALANYTAGGKSALAATGALSAPGKLDLAGLWAKTGTATVSPTPVINQLGIALLAATGAFSATAITEQPGAASLAAIASLSPAVILTFLRSRRMAAGYGFPVPTHGGGVVIIQQRLDGGFVQRKP